MLSSKLAELRRNQEVEDKENSANSNNGVPIQSSLDMAVQEHEETCNDGFFGGLSQAVATEEENGEPYDNANVLQKVLDKLHTMIVPTGPQISSPKSPQSESGDGKSYNGSFFWKPVVGSPINIREERHRCTANLTSPTSNSFSNGLRSISSPVSSSAGVGNLNIPNPPPPTPSNNSIYQMYSPPSSFVGSKYISSRTGPQHDSFLFQRKIRGFNQALTAESLNSSTSTTASKTSNEYLDDELDAVDLLNDVEMTAE